MSDGAPDQRSAHVALGTTEPTTFGSGFLSGMLSAIMGIAAFGVVLSVRFPEYLMQADLRPLYASPYARAIVHLMLVAAFLFGTISAVLRTNKALALTGLGFTLTAALLGGSNAVGEPAMGRQAWFAVDFFVLNLLLYSTVFVPLERLFALRAGQSVFRRHWLVDLTYFFINSLLIEVLTVLTLTPALVLFAWARAGSVTGIVENLPIIVQLPMLVLVADFTQYWVHRTFHSVKFLWPFHAIHHSAEEMDWLAGSRLHLVDVILTRGLTYVPIFVIGFSNAALVLYVLLVAAQATFIHANVRWQLRPLRRLIATPAFHHWHHSADVAATDKNFCVHTPIWDTLFGTYYLPDQWPTRYGLHRGRSVPAGWLRQLLYPFTRRSRR